MLTEDDANQIVAEICNVLQNYHLSLPDGIALLLVLAVDASDHVYKESPQIYPFIRELWDSAQSHLPIAPHERNRDVGVG